MMGQRIFSMVIARKQKMILRMAREKLITRLNCKITTLHSCIITNTVLVIPKYTIDGIAQIVVKTKRIVVLNTPRYVSKFPLTGIDTRNCNDLQRGHWPVKFEILTQAPSERSLTPMCSEWYLNTFQLIKTCSYQIESQSWSKVESKMNI